MYVCELLASFKCKQLNIDACEQHNRPQTLEFERFESDRIGSNRIGSHCNRINGRRDIDLFGHIEFEAVSLSRRCRRLTSKSARVGFSS